LPRISGKAVIKKLKRAGYFEVRYHGDHVWLEHDARPSTSIPLHDIIGPGLMRQILREIQMKPEEFSNL